MRAAVTYGELFCLFLSGDNSTAGMFLGLAILLMYGLGDLIGVWVGRTFIRDIDSAETIVEGDWRFVFSGNDSPVWLAYGGTTLAVVWCRIPSIAGKVWDNLLAEPARLSSCCQFVLLGNHEP